MGLILAMLGSAIAVDIFRLPVLILVGAYFIHRARREETRMLASAAAANAYSRPRADSPCSPLPTFGMREAVVRYGLT
jgi:hypothetical protein